MYGSPTALAYTQPKDCERATGGLETQSCVQIPINDILCVYVRRGARNRNIHGLDVASNSLFIETTNQNVKVSPGGDSSCVNHDLRLPHSQHRLPV